MQAVLCETMLYEAMLCEAMLCEAMVPNYNPFDAAAHAYVFLLLFVLNEVTPSLFPFLHVYCAS
jgi:hypothetical protein